MPEKNKSTVCVEGAVNGSFSDFRPAVNQIGRGLELEARSSLASRSSCNAWTKYLLEPVSLGVDFQAPPCGGTHALTSLNLLAEGCLLSFSWFLFGSTRFDMRDFGVVLAYLHWTGERIVLAADHAADLPKVEKFRPLPGVAVACCSML